MYDNLPPGVSECDIPGNRPEDVAWDAYQDSDEIVSAWESFADDNPDIDEPEDLWEFYETNAEFTCVVDGHFQRWREGPNEGLVQ